MDKLGKIVFTCAKPSKGTAAGGGLSAHIERQIWDAKQKRMVPFQPKSVKHPEKTKLNKEYLLPSDVSRSEAIELRIKEAGITRKIRANQVRCLTFLCTSDRETMERIIAAGRFEEFAQACIDFCKQEFGDKNVVSAVAHFDETTAHLHISVVPIVEGPASERADTKKQYEARKGKAKRAYKKQEVSARLCAKEVFTPEKGEQWQDDIVKFLSERGFDFQRGLKGSQAKHVNPADYNARQEELRALDKQKEELEDDVEMLSAEYRTILEEEQKTNKKIKALNTMLSNLEQEYNCKIANGEAINADLEAKIEDKKQKLAKANEELDEIQQKKSGAEKDLKSAKSGVMAKIFQPGKHKKEEEAKYQAAYSKGAEDTMSAIIKATNLKFKTPPTPENLGKYYRNNWDAKRDLTKQLDDERNAHAKDLQEKNSIIKGKDAELKKTSEELISYKDWVNEELDTNRELKNRLAATDENRVRQLEAQCKAEASRADKAEGHAKAYASQLNDMLNDPAIHSRWNTILRERKEVERQRREEQQRKDAIDRTFASWISDAINAIVAFAKSTASLFCKETKNIVLRGIIAQAHIDGLDATDSKQLTKATDNLLAKVSWSGITEFKADIASIRTHQLCNEVSLTQDIVETVIAPAYVPTPSLGGGGSDNALTNWDGTKKRNGWGR